MVGVDSGEGGVEADGALVQGDEDAEAARRDGVDGDGHRLAVVVEQGVASSEEEAEEVVAAGDGGLDLDGGAAAITEHGDEGDEEVVHAFAQLLHVGVLVGRAFVAIHGDALIHDVAVEIVLLATALDDYLWPAPKSFPRGPVVPLPPTVP